MASVIWGTRMQALRTELESQGFKVTLPQGTHVPNVFKVNETTLYVTHQVELGSGAFIYVSNKVRGARDYAGINISDAGKPHFTEAFWGLLG